MFVVPNTHSLTVILLGIFGSLVAGADDLPPEAEKVATSIFGGTLGIVENRGHWDAPDTLFALDGQGANVRLTAEGPRFPRFEFNSTQSSDSPGASRMLAFAVAFRRSNRTRPHGKSTHLFNFRRGDSAHWGESIPSWEAIHCDNPDDGIELQLHGRRSADKDESTVSPSADCTANQLHHEGIDNLERDDQGSLVIHPAKDWQPLQDGPPLAYHLTKGKRCLPIAASRRLIDAARCAFSVTGQVNPDLPLIVGPCWQWNPDD